MYTFAEQITRLLRREFLSCMDRTLPTTQGIGILRPRLQTVQCLDEFQALAVLPPGYHGAYSPT